MEDGATLASPATTVEPPIQAIGDESFGLHHSTLGGSAAHDGSSGLPDNLADSDTALGQPVSSQAAQATMELLYKPVYDLEGEAEAHGSIKPLFKGGHMLRCSPSDGLSEPAAIFRSGPGAAISENAWPRNRMEVSNLPAGLDPQSQTVKRTFVPQQDQPLESSAIAESPDNLASMQAEAASRPIASPDLPLPQIPVRGIEISNADAEPCSVDRLSAVQAELSSSSPAMAVETPPHLPGTSVDSEDLRQLIGCVSPDWEKHVGGPAGPFADEAFEQCDGMQSDDRRSITAAASDSTANGTEQAESNAASMGRDGAGRPASLRLPASIPPTDAEVAKPSGDSNSELAQPLDAAASAATAIMQTTADIIDDSQVVLPSQKKSDQPELTSMDLLQTSAQRQPFSSLAAAGRAQGITLPFLSGISGSQTGLAVVPAVTRGASDVTLSPPQQVWMDAKQGEP
eukprot:scaffold3704_cov19-Prasinocladus_malaysianus.AAC.1